MDRNDLSEPLLGDLSKTPAETNIFSIEKLKNSKSVKGSGMKNALLDISNYLKENLPIYHGFPYSIQDMKGLKDGIHYIVCTEQGSAIYFDTQFETYIEVKLGVGIHQVVILENESYAYFTTADVIFRISLPDFSYRGTFEDSFKIEDGSRMIDTIVSHESEFLYILFENKLIKTESENFKKREVLLDGKFDRLRVFNDGRLLIAKDDELRVYACDMHLIIQKVLKFDYDLKITPKQNILLRYKNKIQILSSTCLDIMNEIKNESIIESADISSDEKIILIGDFDGFICIHEVETQQLIFKFQLHTNKITFVHLSEDLKWIYAHGSEGKFSRFKYPLLDFKKANKCKDMNTTPSQNSVILYDNNKITRWNYLTDQKYDLYEFPESGYNLHALDKRLIILYPHRDDGKHEIYKIDIKTQTKSSLKIDWVDSDAIYTTDLCREKFLLATGGSNQNVFLWDLQNMVKLRELKGHENCIIGIYIFKNSNEITAGAANGQVKFWNYDLGTEVIPTLNAFKDSFLLLKIYDNETKLITVSQKWEIKIWRWRERQLIHYLKGDDDKYCDFDISKDEKIMICCSKVGKIAVFSLQNFSKLFHLMAEMPVKWIRFSSDERFFLTRTCESSESQVLIYENPLLKYSLCVVGPGDKYEYLRHVDTILNGKCKEYKSEFDDWIIFPYRINTLHLYAFFNEPGLLRHALLNGSSFLSTTSDENPLSLSLSRKFANCASTIIGCFEKMLISNPLSISNMNHHTILQLNNSGISSVEKFYKIIYRKHEGHRAIKFCNDDDPRPFYFHSKEVVPKQQDFSWNNDNTHESKPVHVWFSSVALISVPGSSKSVQFLTSLIESPNEFIFTTKFVKDLLTEKWIYIRKFMYFQAFLYALFMIVLSIYLIKNEAKKFVGTMIILSSFLTVYEIVQFAVSPKEYFKDIWNYVDTARATLAYIYAICLWLNVNEELHYNILVSLVVVSWLKGISYFRIYKNTRYMVNLISEVIKDMGSFLILLLYSTVAFGFIFLVLDKNELKLFNYLMTSFRLDTGDFDAARFSYIEWSIFFLASVINPIIMLNLLISIIGDTFDRVKEESEIADYKELTGIILEIESLLFWKRKSNEVFYFQALLDDESDKAQKSLNERIVEIKKIIKANHKERKNIDQENFRILASNQIRIIRMLDEKKSENKYIIESQTVN